MDVIPGFGSTVRNPNAVVFLMDPIGIVDLSPQKTLAEAKTAHRWYLPADLNIGSALMRLLSPCLTKRKVF